MQPLGAIIAGHDWASAGAVFRPQFSVLALFMDHIRPVGVHFPRSHVGNLPTGFYRFPSLARSSPMPRRKYIPRWQTVPHTQLFGNVKYSIFVEYIRVEDGFKCVICAIKKWRKYKLCEALLDGIAWFDGVAFRLSPAVKNVQDAATFICLFYFLFIMTFLRAFAYHSIFSSRLLVSGISRFRSTRRNETSIWGIGPLKAETKRRR